MKIKVAIIL